MLLAPWDFILRANGLQFARTCADRSSECLPSLCADTLPTLQTLYQHYLQSLKLTTPSDAVIGHLCELINSPKRLHATAFRSLYQAARTCADVLIQSTSSSPSSTCCYGIRSSPTAKHLFAAFEAQARNVVVYSMRINSPEAL